MEVVGTRLQLHLFHSYESLLAALGIVTQAIIEAEESNAEEDDEGVVTDRTDSDEDEESDEENEDEDGQEQEGEEREVDDAMLGDADEEIGDLQEAVVRGGDEDEQVSNPTSHSFTNLFHSRLLQAPPLALYHPLAPGFSLLPPMSLPLPPSPLLPRSLHKHLLPSPSHPPHASTQHRRREPPQEVQGKGRVEQRQPNQQTRQQQRRAGLLRYALSFIRLLF
jgi:hypothetical protein